MNWYVLRVQSGREDRVAENLRKRVKAAGLDEKIPQVLVPTETVSEIKGGKKRTRKRKLYPGYIVCEMATNEGQIDEDVWYLIRETSGIGDFVGAHGRPAPMAPHEVEKMLFDSRQPEETPEVKMEFERGDNVTISEGPFENYEGTVDEVLPDKGLVRVLVTIFGRQAPIELEYWQIVKVTE